MARTIRARLEGPDAAPGRVAAADVARVITGLERAIAQAAYGALGEPRRGTTGRHRAVVEAAARLRFVSIQEGSLVQVLALPDADPATEDRFPLEVTHLSTSAFERLVAAINGEDETDPQLAASIAELADELGIGERNERLTLEDAEPLAVSTYRRAIIDQQVRGRMRAAASPNPSAREDVVSGTLVEADFEKGTARLQPPLGGPVIVRFPTELADDIQAALRQPSELEGVVSYHPTTATAVAVDLQAVSRGVQLTLGIDAEDFWRTRTLSELQAKQGTSGVFDVRELGDPTLSDEERLAFAALRDE
jgi:hypothetical protein